MTDFKHFPRLPRRTQAEIEERRDVFWMLVIICLLVFAFGLAGRDDMQSRVSIDEQTLKEDAIRHARKQADADERAALHFFTERSKP